MRIALDFDGTIAKQDRPYSDITTPLEFIDGAKEAVLALRRAGHLLVLWSGRASRALLVDPLLDPFVRSGAAPLDRKSWLAAKALHWARYHQMVDFVNRELPGVFHAIDDGQAGKVNVDLFIDDKALTLRGPFSWARIARQYGEPEPIDEETPLAELLDRQVETLNLVPTGRLRELLDQVHGELMAAGITQYEPNYVLGQATFWAADQATTVNLPWFLATEELFAAARPRYPWTWEQVLRSIRHEVGHSVNYAFELWRRPDWTALFGDFLEPYPDHQPDRKIDPKDPDFIRYVPGVEPGYGQRHPDEDWAETFGYWLEHAGTDPTGQSSTYKAGALKKLQYVGRMAREVMGGQPTNFAIGPYRDHKEAYRGQTVRQALGLPAKNVEAEQQ